MELRNLKVRLTQPAPVPVTGDSSIWYRPPVAGTPPPIAETEFLARVRNFAEFRAHLSALGLTSDIALLDNYVAHVAACWFRLGEGHLAEAHACLAANLTRATYSRAYYAAYNASKSIRFMTKGWVSLRGDDHKAAPDLPADLPNAAHWGSSITLLYENRLRADYDNWAPGNVTSTMTASDAVSQATVFVGECRTYLNTKYGTGV